MVNERGQIAKFQAIAGSQSHPYIDWLQINSLSSYQSQKNKKEAFLFLSYPHIHIHIILLYKSLSLSLSLSLSHTHTPRQRFHLSLSMTDADTHAKYAYDGKVTLGSAIVLFLVIIILMIFHICGHQCCHSRRHRYHRRSSRLIASNVRTAAAITTYTDNTSLTDTGLESSILRSLPTFVYSADTHRSLQDCAVCLSEFEPDEEVRLLPNCNHAFHSKCIDTWFRSHSNCPLCRAPVRQPDNPRLTECETDPTKEDGASSSSLPAPIGCPRTPLELLGIIVDIPVDEEERLRVSESAYGSKDSDSRILSSGGFLSV